MVSKQLKRASRSARIMILEDDLLNAFLIEDTLKLAGHEIVGPAKTVPEALGLLEMGTTDAAILDLQINDEMSYEVGRKLDRMNIPWAITTAHPPSFVGPQFSHVAFLSKPFGVAALLDLIEKLLDQTSTPKR
jgi:DNA-binding NtrC family response regulator